MATLPFISGHRATREPLNGAADHLTWASASVCHPVGDWPRSMKSLTHRKGMFPSSKVQLISGDDAQRLRN